mmetsp:Transcript_4589/g.14612  ORF Transcript_4589/g.14612 Transcript_4589/m.14612 type:complete len:436 (-) Transcript_4589:1331-2638(-)
MHRLSRFVLSEVEQRLAAREVEHLFDLLAPLGGGGLHEVVRLDEPLRVRLLEPLELEDLLEVDRDAVAVHLLHRLLEHVLGRLHELEHLLRRRNLLGHQLGVHGRRARLAEGGKLEQRRLERADVGLHLLRANLADALAAVDGADQARHEGLDELVAEELDVERQQRLAELRHHLARLGCDLEHVGRGVLAELLQCVPLDLCHRREGRRDARLERGDEHLHAGRDDGLELFLDGRHVDLAAVLPLHRLDDGLLELPRRLGAILGRVDDRAHKVLLRRVQTEARRDGHLRRLPDGGELLLHPLRVGAQVLAPHALQLEQDRVHLQRRPSLEGALERDEELLGRVEDSPVGPARCGDLPRLALEQLGERLADLLVLERDVDGHVRVEARRDRAEQRRWVRRLRPRGGIAALSAALALAAVHRSRPRPAWHGQQRRLL